MAQSKVLFFPAGTTLTNDEQEFVNSLNKYVVFVRTRDIVSRYANGVEPTDYVAGAVPAGYEGIPRLETIMGGSVPAGGTTGQVLSKKTGTDFDTEWITTGGGGSDPKSVASKISFVSDFFPSALTDQLSDGFLAFKTGTGAGVILSGTAVTFMGASTRKGTGVAAMRTGTTATGDASIVTGDTSPVAWPKADFKCYGRTGVAFPALSNGTDTFTFYTGMTASPKAPEAALGAYVKYSHGVNSGKFQIGVKDSGALRTYDSGVTVAANTWYDIQFIWNDAGTEVSVNINGTVLGPYSYNSNDISSMSSAIIKSVGTSHSYALVDYMNSVAEFKTPRAA